MSWLFSQALVEAYSGANSSGGEPSALLNVMPTPQPFWRKDKTTELSSLSQFGLTYAVLTAEHGAELLTSFLADFPARILAPQAGAKESQESEADFGPSSLVSLARYDRDSHSLKTLQTLLFEVSTECLQILPAWGWMRNGECFLLAPRVPHICDAGCSLWPTPRADGRDNCGGSNARKKAQASGTYIGRYPNPILIERLMAWPESWTDLRPQGTGKFQQWLDSHGKL